LPPPPPAGGGPTVPTPGQSAGGVGGVLAGLGGQANMLGILSVAIGILSVLCCGCAGWGGGGAYFFTLILSVAAIVLAVLHLRKIQSGQATNKNLAYIGIGLAVIGLIIGLCFGANVGHTGTDFHNNVR
jgi:hypothetical protein